MSARNGSPSWTDPEYVATVVGVLSVGALVGYSTLADSGPTVDDVLLVTLAITLPATAAYEVARRFG